MAVNLTSTTLVAISCIKHVPTIKALMYSQRHIDFQCVKFITDKKREDFDAIPDNIEIVTLDEPIKNKDDYSRFMLYNLKDYIFSNYVMTVQYDGFIINPFGWREHWMMYDYIGAPFPPFYVNRENENEIVRVGNGGFSFRSKKFIDLFSKLNLEIIEDSLTGIAEDHQQCCMYNTTYREHGIKYAPVEEAVYFSHENFTLTPEVRPEILPFGFHTCRGYEGEPIYDNFYYPYFES